jgi:galactokinase/mevalonate kinase-like predicted kinase
MAVTEAPMQFLLTLPPRMAAEFEVLESRKRPEWFAACDPEGAHLGSGGGTANLLAEAWRHESNAGSFKRWLAKSRKLILHAGGQSRRLPAYAPSGKLLIPLPVARWARGQRLDQTLLDLQLPDYQRVLSHAGPQTVVMITSGDVLLRFSRDLPPFPDVDVLGLGMWVTPEKAKDFGVFVTARGNPTELAFFLQKPPPGRIRELGQDHLCLVDTGMWLLSERAVLALMAMCGWEENGEKFNGGRAAGYELYAQFGLALGKTPSVPDARLSHLTSAVVPLPEAQFYHFGTSRQMIDSVAALQTLVLDESKVGSTGANDRPDQVTQNSRFAAALKRQSNSNLWVENSVIPETWQINSDHVFTGVPQNNWRLTVPAGVCLDFVPVGESDYCVRPYHMEDSFSGTLGDEATRWLGRPVLEWFQRRGLSAGEAGLDLNQDIQHCPLFPLIPESEIQGDFVSWLFAAASSTDFPSRWIATRRLSAHELLTAINLPRLHNRRASLRRACIAPMLRNFRRSVFFRLDLESTARLFAAGDEPLPELELSASDRPMTMVHDPMFRSAVVRHRRRAGWKDYEARAFAKLREILARGAQLSPAVPHRSVLDDQIVWARSPVRLDLAGGWTDTPPYCLEHGGKVINLAVDLNGQPPIQVFAKLCERPELVVRSIDLGVEDRIRNYAELDTFATPGSAFALAKAAFALAGFLPRFHGNGGFPSLEAQLRDFGGGIEVSLLSAVPKGSGLGTSSILAATVLAAIGDLCGLGWDRNVLFARTLALEQMLTTGGGWQDQAGAIFRGIKVIETSPGLVQRPSLRWLPHHLVDRDYANRLILLYYTGITRLAKNILAEIVRGIFLNSPSHLEIIGEIGANAEFAAAAVQKCDYGVLQTAIQNSWRLNQRLDPGTNPPPVQRILDQVQDFTGAAKLLGAGGGGYLLLFAKDETAGNRIRQSLTETPPNNRARFVDFTLSETGLQLTRS